MNWLALYKLAAGMAASYVFFRLYAGHDARERKVRLLQNTYEGGAGADLVHSGRHAVRIGFTLVVAQLVAPGLVVAALPAWFAVAGLGYLIFDPAINRDMGRAWDYAGTGNNWDTFIRLVTGRADASGRWSAYVEAVLLVANVVWYAYLTR